MGEMEKFIVTFGRFGLRNAWVEVSARDERIARAWARKEYGSVWSGIYTLAEWQSGDTASMFTAGCVGSTVLHYESAEHVG